MKQLYVIVLGLLLLQVPMAAVAQIRYATAVVDFSTQYSPGSYGAIQVLEAPNGQGRCGDLASSWCPASADGRREYLVLDYANPAPINRILIHETWYAGAVDTVYVFNNNTQQYVKVYEATAAPATCPRAFEITLPVTGFPVSRVRIALNSPAVPGYNEIDAVGIGLVTEGGAIGYNQNICGTELPEMFISQYPAFGGQAGVTYRWQDSTENGHWNDIANATSVTYQPPVISKHTWYRRKAELNAAVLYSNEVKLTLTLAGDPSVFPVNGWNFYAHSGNSLDLFNTSYKGYYNRNELNFNTADHYPLNGYPSQAQNYQGCPLPINNFVLVAKRKGFPAGNYLMVPKSANKWMRVYVNGTLIANVVQCCNALSLGLLNADSEVEIRLSGDAGYTNMNIEFQTGELNGGEIQGNQSVCSDETPSSFSNKQSAYGGAAPASISYQWQDSVANGSWTNIPNATAGNYQHVPVSVSTWFRRMAKDNTGATAYSNEIKQLVIIPPGDTAVYGNQSWIFYAFNGTNISLENTRYRGYYAKAGLNFDTHSDWAYWEIPSNGVNYSGCKTKSDEFILSARRIGFAAGIYRLDLSSMNNHVQLFVNGQKRFDATTSGTINIGYLDAASKVEIRLKDGGGYCRLEASFVTTISEIAEYSGTACLDYSLNINGGNEWFDFTDATGKVIASINPNGNNLGLVTLTARHFGTGASNIPVNPVNNMKYMPRYFTFRSTAYPQNAFPQPVSLRLYYRNNEMDDYKTATAQPGLLRSAFVVAHYNGNNEDCYFQNNQHEGEEISILAASEFTTAGFFIELPTNSFSEFGVLGGTQGLPVSLVQFNAIKSGKAVQLSWVTAQETGNKGFELFRSSDGQKFEKIAWINGHGTTSEAKRYMFSDDTAPVGTVFYQLRQVDLDGHASMSRIVKVVNKAFAVMKIAPNPVEHTLFIDTDMRNIATLKILDWQGRTVWKYEAGNNAARQVVPVGHLMQGTYLLELTDKQGRRQTEKFVKK